MLKIMYCDESCHLQHDGYDVMVLGGVECPSTQKKEINRKIKEIKVKYGLNEKSEIKWTKISTKYENLYKELIDYFFAEDFLKARILIATHKKDLEHEKYFQTHDSWYYKMYYTLLEKQLLKFKNDRYKVLLDIKDTQGGKKVSKLDEYLNNKTFNLNGVYQINSKESEILQIADLLIGLLSYNARFDLKEKQNTKTRLVNYIKTKHNINLNKSSDYLENKFNIFIWIPQGVSWEGFDD